MTLTRAINYVNYGKTPSELEVSPQRWAAMVKYIKNNSRTSERASN